MEEPAAHRERFKRLRVLSLYYCADYRRAMMHKIKLKFMRQARREGRKMIRALTRWRQVKAPGAEILSTVFYPPRVTATNLARRYLLLPLGQAPSRGCRLFSVLVD